jgi:hypothetical protein
LQIHYVLVAEGPECVLYREIHEGQFHEQAKRRVDLPLLVLRYLGENVPGPQALVNDMDVAVGRAITLLSHKVQSGS